MNFDVNILDEKLSQYIDPYVLENMGSFVLVSDLKATEREHWL
jgi:hypothetical protein